jgi:hypothetical protein
LVVTSRNPSVTNTSTFDNVTVSGTAGSHSGEIVIYANDLSASALHGSWVLANDSTSPNAKKLATPDNGVSQINAPLAAPTDYVDVTFSPQPGVPYTLWLRMKASADNKFNDSLWAQFSNAQVNGAPVYQINSTSGLLVNLATDSGAGSLNAWGWKNSAYWLSQPTTVTFAAGGTQTLRIQVREDGVQVDQIVLSPTTYLESPPGPETNDSTIVPKN